MSGSKILVVDDEKIVSLDIQSSLKRLGYAVVGEAVSAEEAVKKAGGLRPDLVLMDIKLRGDADGIQAAEQIARLFDIPVVFLTAYSDDQTLNRAKLSGPFGYLLKPFEERDLHSAIEVALYKHKMEQDLRSAMRAAEAANEAKSSFLATVSHELRTPLNGILGMTELLSLTSLDKEQGEYLKLVKESACSLLSVLNDILDYSKIEAKVLGLREGEFDLLDILGSALEPHTQMARRKGLTLECRVHEGLPRKVKGDSGRLKQVLNHLVNNALKFTSQGGALVEVGPADGDRASGSGLDEGVPVFSVTDTGRGIPHEQLSQVFDSFTQGEDYLTRNQGGLGLGLAISRKLVGLMGGSIWVESEPGLGSTFFFTAGLSATNTCGSQKMVKGSGGALFGIKVLVVEDNLINRKVAMSLLEAQGCRPTAAENGREALDRLGREDFDLVLMDIQMPVMDGMEATRRIRAADSPCRNPRIPIIALTAHAMKGDDLRCLGVGMNAFVAKPISVEALLGAMQAVLADQGGKGVSMDAAEPPGDLQVFDPEGALRRMGDDRELLREVCQVFLADSPRRVEEMRHFLALGDMQSLARLAHAFKGMCADAGADAARALVDQILTLARNNESASVENLFPAFCAALDKAAASMKEHLLSR